MSFLEQAAADVANVFLNDGEFAERRSVRYEGERWDDIPVVLTKLKQWKRVQLATDHTEGLHQVGVIAHMAQADINGATPQVGRWIEISDGTAIGSTFFARYLIVTATDNMGMITLELEAIDE